MNVMSGRVGHPSEKGILVSPNSISGFQSICRQAVDEQTDSVQDGIDAGSAALKDGIDNTNEAAQQAADDFEKRATAAADRVEGNIDQASGKFIYQTGLPMQF